MKGKFPVKIPDIVVILLFAGLTVVSGVYVFAGAGDVSRVVIQGPNNRTWIFPLDEDRTVPIRGVLGDDTVVRISGGQVWAESSPCPTQVCVGMGRLGADSWWPLPVISCLPNRVSIWIEGAAAGGGGHIDGAAW